MLSIFGLCVCTANAVDLSASKHSSQFQSIEKTEDTPMFPKKLPEPPQLKEHPPSMDSSDGEDDIIPLPQSKPRKERSSSGQLSQHSRSTHSFDLQVIKLYVFLFYLLNDFESFLVGIFWAAN